MKPLKTILILVFFVLITATFVFSEDLKIRVTVSKANIRLKPTIQSEILTRVPLGAVLEAIKKQGNWYFIKLPPDEKGIVVTGYIHQSIVEAFEETKQPVELKKETVEKKEDVIVKKEKPLKIPPKPVESPKGVSRNLDYSRWKEEYFRAEKDIDLGAKYQTMGLLAMIGGPTAIAIGVITKIVIFDVMGAAAGSAGIGLYAYGYFKKNRAEDKLQVLKKEGKVKKYLSAYINPAKRYYAVSFCIEF